MPESPGWGYTISDTPSARLSSVYIVISELDMLIWWHELSMLLIHHCISAFALTDNLFFPVTFVLFFSSINDSIIFLMKKWGGGGGGGGYTLLVYNWYTGFLKKKTSVPIFTKITPFKVLHLLI